VNADVAVIGCGYWGKNLVRNFHALEALSLVCDTEESGLAKARELAPGVPQTTRLEDVLASDVSAVVVATPAESHASLVRQAIEAGKDVFVEKPLALTYEDGAPLVRMAHEKGRILMVGHILEYHPSVIELARMVHTGELGDLQYVYSNRLNLGKIRREENILWSFAPHDIAVILALVGQMPIEVSAVGGAYVQPDIPDTTITNLLFDGGVRSHVFVSWLHPFKEQRLVVIGSRQMAVFDDVAKKLLLYDQRVDLMDGEPVPVKAEPTEVDVPAGEPLRRECEAFLEAVVTRRPPVTDGQEGLRVLSVLQAAQVSLGKDGEAVELLADHESAVRAN